MKFVSNYLKDLYPYAVRVFIWTAIFTAFVIFLRNLKDRFEALNSLLRFAIPFSTSFGDQIKYSLCMKYNFQILTNIRHQNRLKFQIFFVVILNDRNQFLSGNTLMTSIIDCKDVSIEIIRFIGCQHSLLTDIMDQLNWCYSFEVSSSSFSFFSWNRIHFLCLMMIVKSFYGNFHRL